MTYRILCIARCRLSMHASQTTLTGAPTLPPRRRHGDAEAPPPVFAVIAGLGEGRERSVGRIVLGVDLGRRRLLDIYTSSDLIANSPKLVHLVMDRWAHISHARAHAHIPPSLPQTDRNRIDLPSHQQAGRIPRSQPRNGGRHRLLLARGPSPALRSRPATPAPPRPRPGPGHHRARAAAPGLPAAARGDGGRGGAAPPAAVGAVLVVVDHGGRGGGGGAAVPAGAEPAACGAYPSYW